MIPQLTQIFSIFSGGKFIWKVIRNYRVLSDAVKNISDVLKQMHDAKRATPEANETSVLLLSVSNILKTGVIDVPGVDEYELALGVDQINTNFVLSVKDAKSDKFHQIKFKKKGGK